MEWQEWKQDTACAPAEEMRTSKAHLPETRKSKVPGSRHVWQGILLTAAVFMIIYGVSRGEVETVLNKAVNICLECVGLG